MGTKVVIVGGVAGGASAAARLRRLDEQATIILFEKGDYISFANCGLPYYIGDVIREKEKLLVQTPEGMKRRFRIDVRVGSEVRGINREEKTVEVFSRAENRTYTESYDKLILSPGAEPVRPDIPGMENEGIYTLRNIPDTYAIRDFVDQHHPSGAVIVGAGFIGLELAENLAMRGIAVTVVELADHVVGPLDYEMACLVEQHLHAKGVRLYLKNAVTAFERDGASLAVRLSEGACVKADMAVVGIGVRPESGLAAKAGLKLGETGGIWTDAHMRTSDPDIYAVGDAAEVRDFVSGGRALIPLAGPANKQGRVAADNICGRDEEYEGTQGTSIVKVFDLTVALTGSGERALRRRGVPYEKSFTHSASHAGYYPGAIPMSIKLLFAKKDGRILGAQIVGYDGVDKRIDVLAAAMRAGMTVHDLEKLELAYAPPYSSAKDPVNLAGYTASNILKGDWRVFHWEEVDGIDTSENMLIDVRTPQEYALGTIRGAVNIPLDDLRDRLSDIPREKRIYLFCQVGLRGYVAARILMQSGYAEVYNLSGGYRTYQAAKTGLGRLSAGGGEETCACAGAPSGEKEARPAAKLELDACGLQCPGPIMKVYEAVKKMKNGDVVEVKATDPAFQEDVKTWCRVTGNTLLDVSFDGSQFSAAIRKEASPQGPGQDAASASSRHDKSMIVFSNDLDRAIASFIIANGALSMGRKVTMFFTFWGLNILRKPEKTPVKKDLIASMFGRMMPRGSRKLALSKMNMAGFGPKLIRGLMRKKDILSLEALMEQAKKSGVRFVACNMSMDIMGIKREELIDGVEIGGVATFLGSAEQSDMSLFI